TDPTGWLEKFRLAGESATAGQLLVQTFSKKASPERGCALNDVQPLHIVWYGMRVGKLVEKTCPVRYAFPAASTAIPQGVSTSLPPKYVENSNAAEPDCEKSNFARKASVSGKGLQPPVHVL